MKLFSEGVPIALPDAEDDSEFADCPDCPLQLAIVICLSASLAKTCFCPVYLVLVMVKRSHMSKVYPHKDKGYQELLSQKLESDKGLVGIKME